MENEDRLYPALGRARPGRAAARMDARIQLEDRTPVLLRALGRALRLRAERIPDRDARQARARRAPVVEGIRLLKNASRVKSFCVRRVSEGSVFLQPPNWGIARGRSPLQVIWYRLTND